MNKLFIVRITNVNLRLRQRIDIPLEGKNSHVMRKLCSIQSFVFKFSEGRFSFIYKILTILRVDFVVRMVGRKGENGSH